MTKFKNRGVEEFVSSERQKAFTIFDDKMVPCSYCVAWKLTNNGV